METLQKTFLEDPLYVYISLAIAELVLAAIWHERRSRKSVLMLLIPPVLAGAVCIVAAVVVTDREQILRAATEIADDVAAGGSAAVKKYLDKDFAGRYQGHRLDKAGAVAACRGETNRFRIIRIKLTSPTISVTGDSAEMHVTAFMRFETGVAGARTVPVGFQVFWIKRGGSWLIFSADEPQI